MNWMRGKKVVAIFWRIKSYPFLAILAIIRHVLIVNLGALEGQRKKQISYTHAKQQPTI